MTANHHRQSRGGAPRMVGTVHLTPGPMALNPAGMHERHWPHRLGEMIAAFAGKRIVVLGDMIADEYVVGTAARLSRDAPIPVITQRERFTVPGGALNPAVNARALGAEVHVAGLIGDDECGRRLRQRLTELGIHHDLLMSEAKRPTSVKMRVLAGNSQGAMQHVARIDAIDTTPPDADTVQRLIDGLAAVLGHIDGIILSDYDNGLMVLPLIEGALRQAQRANLIVVADAHSHLERYQRVTAITPNQGEAEDATGLAIRDHGSLMRAGSHLLAATNAHGVLITRGGDGMTLFHQDGTTADIPAYPSEVRDTTGAGDTVAATFTLGLTTGAAMADAATLANVAAGLVVRRLGCATTTPEELLHAVASLEATW